MKKILEQEMLEDAIHEIAKIAPKHSEVEIDVDENSRGIFSTHIRLITKKHIYFAKKEDSFLRRSFSKAMRAIKAQVKKNKSDHHAVKYSLMT